MFENFTVKPAPYKYRLKELFVKEFGKTTSQAQKAFATHFKRGYERISQECNYSIYDADIITPDHLKQYADFFRVPVEKLRNHIQKKEIHELV